MDRRETLLESSQSVQDDSRPIFDAAVPLSDRSDDPDNATPAPPARIKVRFAAEMDREALRLLARWQHEQTLFGDIPFCDAKFDRLFDRWRSGQHHQCGIVAELGGAVVGGLYASAGEYQLGQGAVLTTVHAIAVDGRNTHPAIRAKVFLQLLRGVKEWSKTRGSRHVMVHATTGVNARAVDRLMRSAGGEFVGGAYAI